MNDPIQARRLSNDIRVILIRWERGYAVVAQQYMPHCNYYWEVGLDGWRDTVFSPAATLEGARREFENRVRQEERYLEARRKAV